MSVSERTANTLRRLHSLTGILPIGAFLCFHLFINSKAVQGHLAYRTAADELAKLPYVILLELFAIALPIVFHMVLGILIVVNGQMNTPRFPYERNWGYVLQRASGVYLVFFLVFHVWTTRFSAVAMRPDGDLFELMSRQLASPGVFALYVIGVSSAAYHLGNGLFGFAIHWGIATGRNAQRQAARLGLAVGLVLALVGINSLLGFTGHGVRLFERAPAEAPVARTEVRR
jgi:succinate dehydrogenase / fumarate reductase, cytochrome b subunit